VKAVIPSLGCLPAVTIDPAMTHHDEFLDNDERPRSSKLAAGVVGTASVLRD